MTLRSPRAAALHQQQQQQPQQPAAVSCTSEAVAAAVPDESEQEHLLEHTIQQQQQQQQYSKASKMQDTQNNSSSRPESAATAVHRTVTRPSSGASAATRSNSAHRYRQQQQQQQQRARPWSAATTGTPRAHSARSDRTAHTTAITNSDAAAAAVRHSDVCCYTSHTAAQRSMQYSAVKRPVSARQTPAHLHIQNFHLAMQGTCVNSSSSSKAARRPESARPRMEGGSRDSNSCSGVKPGRKLRLLRPTSARAHKYTAADSFYSNSSSDGSSDSGSDSEYVCLDDVDNDVAQGASPQPLAPATAAAAVISKAAVLQQRQRQQQQRARKQANAAAAMAAGAAAAQRLGPWVEALLRARQHAVTAEGGASLAINGRERMVRHVCASADCGPLQQWQWPAVLLVNGKPQ
jgi:hypothetical protein